MSIAREVADLLRRSLCILPEDVVRELRRAYERERGIARIQMDNILRNISIAEREMIPMCQDTGIPVFFVESPDPGIEREIRRGVKIATEMVPMRRNLADPISRKVLDTNVSDGMPPIYYSRSDRTRIRVLIRGAGAENSTFLKILDPADSDAVAGFVVDEILKRCRFSCPPVVVGVGIGGTPEVSLRLSMEALLHPLGTWSRDPTMRRMEKRIMRELNRSGIGPMGLGGKTTCIGARVESAPTHIASLPVSVSLQCWATRRGEIVL